MFLNGQVKARSLPPGTFALSMNVCLQILEASDLSRSVTRNGQSDFSVKAERLALEALKEVDAVTVARVLIQSALKVYCYAEDHMNGSARWEGR